MDSRHRALMTLAALALPAAGAGCESMMWSRGFDAQKYVNQEPPMTMVLAFYQGPDSRNTAERVRDKLKDAGFKKAFVVADDDEAYLCHGVYDGFEDKRYLPEKNRLAQVRETPGKLAFGRPTASPLPETTPPTPYDLSTAPGEFTVQVATFDLYGRKNMANGHVAKLPQGWDAYVHHGDVQSPVTIGSFDNRIFDNWARTRNVLDPARVISPEVKRILKTFQYQNWNGHQFTADEAAKIKVTKKHPVIDPKTGRISVGTSELSETILSSHLVRIPNRVQRLNPPGTLPPPGPLPPPTTIPPPPRSTLPRW